MITPERKKELIAEYATGKDDTGSPEVQVAVLSERRSLLDYVKKTDVKRYESLIARLGLRR